MGTWKINFLSICNDRNGIESIQTNRNVSNEDKGGKGGYINFIRECLIHASEIRQKAMHLSDSFAYSHSPMSRLSEKTLIS